jgi:hypothetical protein
MKFSETQEPLKKIRIDYINTRWKQLLELVEDSGRTALQYLFLTNSGGAATTLAFIGTVGVDKIGTEAKWALGFFVLGVILVGFARAREFYHLRGLFNQWKSLTNAYFTNEKSWGEIIEADNQKVDGEKWVFRLPWMSFVCFIVGCGFGSTCAVAGSLTHCWKQRSLIFSIKPTFHPSSTAPTHSRLCCDAFSPLSSPRHQN